MVVDGCNCWYNKRRLCGCEGRCLRRRLMLVATITAVRQGLGQFVTVLGIVGIAFAVGTAVSPHFALLDSSLAELLAVAKHLQV